MEAWQAVLVYPLQAQHTQGLVKQGSVETTSLTPLPNMRLQQATKCRTKFRRFCKKSVSARKAFLQQNLQTTCDNLKDNV